MIRIKDVHIGYRSTLFTTDDLTLEAGNVYALLGPNGKGKTTFLKTLSGIIPPVNGTIQINERNVSALSPEAISKLVAFVTPRFEGVDHLTVFNYILLGRTPYLRFTGKPSNKDIEVVEKILHETGLDRLRSRNTDKISDGERQLSSIGRALAQETPVLFLDEPTAFLDYSNKILILRTLKKIAAEQNKCIVFSSHDIELCLQEEVNLLLLSKENELILKEHSDKNEIVRLCFENI